MYIISIPFSKNNTWLELLRHTVSLQTYSTTSSRHFLLLTPCTPAVTGWAHCWVFAEVRSTAERVENTSGTLRRQWMTELKVLPVFTSIVIKQTLSSTIGLLNDNYTLLLKLLCFICPLWQWLDKYYFLLTPLWAYTKYEEYFYRAMLAQSAVMRLHVVRLSVCNV